MNRNKIIKIAILGVASAAIICIIAGICIYVPALGINPLRSDPAYSSVMADKLQAMQLGMLILIVGCSCFIFSSVAFLAVILFGKILKQRENDSKDNQNITE